MRVERLLQAGGPNAAANAQEQQEFADWLKRIGEGTEHVYPVHGDEAILLPPEVCCTTAEGSMADAQLDDLIREVSIQAWVTS